MTCPRCGHTALPDDPHSYTVTDDGVGLWRRWTCCNSPACGHSWWTVKSAEHAQDKPTGGEAA